MRLIDDWEIYFFKIFYEQYHGLIKEVQALKRKRPKSYKRHFKTKFLKRLKIAIFSDVPSDPLHPKFNLGKTLGAKYKQFRRVKKGMPQRYRLFFQFSSQAETIVFIWVNDESSIRGQGGKHDVYNVFKSMIDNGTIPQKYSALFDASAVCELPKN